MKKGPITLALVCAFFCAYSNIRLPHVIGSNMVLQQQSQVKLWGWSDPGEKISVTASWDSKPYAVTASRDARWEVTIPTGAAGGPYTITFKGNNSIVLNNVMLGEVWVCSGQSNMEMSGKRGLEDIKAALPNAYNNNIRFFQIPKTTAREPQDDCAGEWTICDSATLNTFSGVAYFFGKQLNSRLKNVPIGLIQSCWGGTTAEVWTPDSIVNADPVLKTAAARIEPSSMCPYLPGYTYNAMIAPLTQYAIAGVIWYQGENNTGTASTYHRLFTTMMDAWRKAWGKELPFYYVQIAPYRYRLRNVGALLREAQLQSMQHPHTGMVVTTDLVTDTNDVHPHNKHDVGLRLANWALAETYGQTGFPYKSPVPESMSIKKDKAVITFQHAAQGLTFRGKNITTLQIAGEDRIFHTAEASVKGNTIIVKSRAVKSPVAVRYGFSNTAMGNLFSTSGLPVAPFRTDNWPIDL